MTLSTQRRIQSSTTEAALALKPPKKLRFHDPRTLVEWRLDPRYPARLGSRFLPDGVYETTKKRLRLALREGGKHDQLQALLEAYGTVRHVVLDLFVVKPDEYYDRELIDLATRAVKSFLEEHDSMGSFTIRISRKGKLHAHVTMRGDSPSPGQHWSRLLKDTDDDRLRLAAYLTGPADEAAWRPDLQARLDAAFDDETLRQEREAAADRLLQAQHDVYHQGGSTRLPAMAGHTIARELMRKVKSRRPTKATLVEAERTSRGFMPFLGDLIFLDELETADTAKAPTDPRPHCANPLRIQLETWEMNSIEELLSLESWSVNSQEQAQLRLGSSTFELNTNTTPSPEGSPRRLGRAASMSYQGRSTQF